MGIKACMHHRASCIGLAYNIDFYCEMVSRFSSEEAEGV